MAEITHTITANNRAADGLGDAAESARNTLRQMRERPVDLNQFLRRADVEALLDAKIMACTEKMNHCVKRIGEYGEIKPDAHVTALAAIADDLLDNNRRRGALMVAKRHLDTLDQFTLKSNADIGEDPSLMDRSDVAVEVK